MFGSFARASRRVPCRSGSRAFLRYVVPNFVDRGKLGSGIVAETSLILAAVFWGSNYAATKFAALSLPPLSIVALRFVGGGLLMYAVLRLLEPKSRLRRGDLLSMAGLGQDKA